MWMLAFGTGFKMETEADLNMHFTTMDDLWQAGTQLHNWLGGGEVAVVAATILLATMWTIGLTRNAVVFKD
ncbi:hypothetical protein QJS10_CPA07g00411 [Acorus calamus]|uniref:Uncharacterized protein n=1 Tax=Acorus calamus TaxID=4465 RepID=A0AAV9EGZ6_ACOCL|nr:hypothetical protein QJS10_CPA07g00411 [Acorus calamus]